MRTIGTKAFGIRLPIINKGDDLIDITVQSLKGAVESDGLVLSDSDIIGVTESILAKAQGNYASLEQIATDIRQKYPEGEVGLVFPIPSRNRFLNVLKGIAAGCDKVYVLLQYPHDEVGNPIMLNSQYQLMKDQGKTGLLSAAEFREVTKDYRHPYTDMDYIALYEGVGDNVEVYLSDDNRDILKLTKQVLNCEIHRREDTSDILKRNGAERIHTLCDILNEPVDGSGYNEHYGLLGSNLATNDSVKLFPRDCAAFVNGLQKAIKQSLGASPEVLVYGDGAYKDPASGIWELADPVVSPAYTERLGGLPVEVKIKYVVDEYYGHMSAEEKQREIKKLIAKKSGENADGTTPRRYYNLVGSLCDLMSGSGDKGTPVILIQGYFDDYSK